MVKCVRIYADAAGESHLEEIEYAAQAGTSGRGLPEMLLQAKGILFRTGEVGQVIDWHTAPRRQILVNLSGEWEIETSDGETRRIGPGMLLLADDLTGKGHVTRTVGAGPRVTMIVPLAD